MSPKIVDKEVKKAEILQAAMQVFAQKGVAKTKMMDIANAAGIGKGTIYEYFRSKENIFGSAFLNFFGRIEQEITEALEKTEDPIEKLQAFIKISAHIWLDTDARFAGIIMDFWAEGIRNKDENILGIINLEQIYTEYRRMIGNILNDGIRQGVFRSVDTTSVSALIIATLDGIMLQWIINRELFDINHVGDVLLDSLLNGIRK